MKQFIVLSIIIAFASANFLGNTIAADNNITITQQLFDGFWLEANVTAPNNLAEKCFDTKSAALFVQTVNQTLAYLADDQVLPAMAVCNKFNQELPDDVKKCLKANPKTQEVYDHYGISNLTLTQFEAKVGGFILSHFNTVRSQLQNANDDFQSGAYNQTGIDAGIFLKEAL